MLKPIILLQKKRIQRFRGKVAKTTLERDTLRRTLPHPDRDKILEAIPRLHELKQRFRRQRRLHPMFFERNVQEDGVDISHRTSFSGGSIGSDTHVSLRIPEKRA